MWKMLCGQQKATKRKAITICIISFFGLFDHTLFTQKNKHIVFGTKHLD